MRIGIDLRLHAYAPGGISRYARRLAPALANLLDPGALTLVRHRRDVAPPCVPDARIYRAWTPPHHALERWTLGAELAPLRLDLFHSTDFIPPAWGARRRVITVHDLNFLYYPEHLTAEARRYYNDQIMWAVDRADAILADSHATRRDLEAQLGVPPERITVTHLAADAIFRPLPEAQVRPVLARYGLAPGYLLFVGTWEPRKNLVGLVEALARLHARGEKRTLVFVGRPGWLYDRVFARIEALHLQAWVGFIEEVPVADLVGLYNGALLLAMPSFYEGFGLPALEAMQCGTPTVVADRASLPEVVGKAGLLIDPEEPDTLAEACWRIAHDEALRRRLTAAGRRRARTFTWTRTARKTLDVYNAMLNDPS
jgi:glycosyltransferase involved in cell wall biosynthesis